MDRQGCCDAEDRQDTSRSDPPPWQFNESVDPIGLSHRWLLDRYVPASVLLDRELRPLEFLGDLEGHLCPGRGSVTGTIVDQLPPPMALAVETARQRLEQSGADVVQRLVRIGERRIELTMRRIEHRGLDQVHYLLIFPCGDEPPTMARGETADESLADAQDRIRMLEMRLRRAIQSRREHAGRPAGLVTAESPAVYAPDASSLRRSQELAEVLAGCSDAVIGVRLDGRIVSWNDAATRLLGDRFSSAVNSAMLITDRLPDGLRETVQSKLARVAIMNQVGEKELSLAIGERSLTLRVRVTPTTGADGKPTGAVVLLQDVTTLRSALQELRLRNRAIEAATSGIAIVDALDAERPIVYVNEAFTRITGYDRSMAVGRNCRFLQGPKTEPQTVDAIRRAVQAGEAIRVTLLNYRRDGREFYNELSISPVHDDDGQLTHFIGVQNDVTDRVAATQRLTQSEREARATFESTAIGIGHVGLDGSWRSVNRRLCEIVGYTSEELLDRPLQDITHPDDLGESLKRFGPLVRGQSRGYNLEQRYLHSRGHVVWVRLTTSLRTDDDGRPHSVIAFVEDISIQKQVLRDLADSRQIVSEVIDNTNDVFLSVDSQNRIRIANHAAEKLAAIGRPTLPKRVRQVIPVVGEPITAVLGEEADDELFAAIDRVVATRCGETMEFHHVAARRWYDVRLIATGAGVSLSMSDATIRKETESQLQRAREAAEEASRAKTRFLTNMSHEIRSPLTSILGFVDIAARDLGAGRPVDPHHLDLVGRNGRFLLQILNDILDLSKVESGRLPIRRTRFHVLTMIGEVLDLMRHRSQTAGVSIDVHLGGPVPERIHSDRARIEQILVNLIGNALKFSPGGDVKINVRTETIAGQSNAIDAGASVRGGQSQLLISVIDNGIGIAAEKLPRLFETFSQLHDPSMANTVEGSGLGLAISQRLAGLLGGDITVSSVENEGSTFTLRLPLQSSDCDALLPADATATSHRPRAKRLAEISGPMLVVDDARDIRLLVRTILTRAGAKVTEACDGQEAVQLVQNAQQSGQPYRCVLMDMQMPVLSGQQATSLLRSQGHTLPIVALTAGATREEVAEAMRSGCTEFLGKPVDSAGLVRCVASLTS